MPIDGYSDRRDSAPRPAAASAKPRSVMAERRRRLLLKRCQPLRQKPPIDYVRGCHAGDTTSPSLPPALLAAVRLIPRVSRISSVSFPSPRVHRPRASASTGCPTTRFLGIRGSFRRLFFSPRKASPSIMPLLTSLERLRERGFASLVWESRVEIAGRFNFRRRPSAPARAEADR